MVMEFVESGFEGSEWEEALTRRESLESAPYLRLKNSNFLNL